VHRKNDSNKREDSHHVTRGVFARNFKDVISAPVKHPVELSRATVSPRALLIGWLLAGLMLVMFLDGPSVTRTQEARVLETARQMLPGGLHDWLVPYLNEKPRLEKPPLSYWLSAAMYSVWGVNEFAGRLPTALAGWFTVGLTMLFARRVFDDRVALASGAALVGSYIFFRFTRLAETDAMATLLITAAVYSIVRAAGPGRAMWHHLAGLAMGFAVLSKGPPAVFALVFLITVCAVERRWDVLRRFILVGAPLTFCIVAGPWFWYVIRDQSWDVFKEELRTTTTGEDHFNWPHVYIYGLLIASAPWSAMLPLALYDAFRRFRIDPGARLTLLWFLAILVPLCINGNKQNHYLIMLAPPMMTLVARLVVAPPQNLAGWVRGVGVGMMFAAVCAAIAVPVVGKISRGRLITADWIFASALLLAAIAVVVTVVRRGVGRGLVALLPAVAVIMPLLVGYWLPKLDRVTMRDVATQVRHVGPGPYIFYGPNLSLPLAFTLRSTIPVVPDADELRERATPDTIVIAITKDRAAAPPLPAEYMHHAQIKLKRNVFDVYKAADAKP
jgi:4-amino-4-deoxy-L-arabinose transferase-like glycosyltransferase